MDCVTTTCGYGDGVIDADVSPVLGSARMADVGPPSEPTAGPLDEVSGELLTCPAGWLPPGSAGAPGGVVVEAARVASGPTAGLAVFPLAASEPMDGSVPEPGVVDGCEPEGVVLCDVGWSEADAENDGSDPGVVDGTGAVTTGTPLGEACGSTGDAGAAVSAEGSGDGEGEGDGDVTNAGASVPASAVVAANRSSADGVGAGELCLRCRGPSGRSGLADVPAGQTFVGPGGGATAGGRDDRHGTGLRHRGRLGAGGRWCPWVMTVRPLLAATRGAEPAGRRPAAGT